MSKIVGIIAEYNPFHNGHLHHIEETKKKTGADFVICIMGGNFTQRGECSIVNKWDKTRMAIECGADLVIELPTIYTVSSAENFANGAVRLLNELKCIDYLSFGAETDDLEELKKIAKVLKKEPSLYRSFLKQELKSGVSYPKAREIALTKYFINNKYEQILKNSNNILAIEYLKALENTKSKIKPIVIKRKNVDFNEESIKENFASATSIRKLIREKQFKEIQKVVPKSSYDILYKSEKVENIDIFEKEIICKLRQMSNKELLNIPEVGEGLDNLIKKGANQSNTYAKLLEMLKTKRYAQSRIQRILIYILLGIKKKDMENSKKINPYVRVLGTSENGRKILSILGKDRTIQLITTPKRYIEGLKNKKLRRMLEIDILSTDTYTLGYQKEEVQPKMDFTMKIISNS